MKYGQQAVVRNNMGPATLSPMRADSNTTENSSPLPSPVLNQLVERLGGNNERFGSLVSRFQELNDRLTGAQPHPSSAEKIDCGPGVVHQIEYNIRIYEALLGMMINELERLTVI